MIQRAAGRKLPRTVLICVFLVLVYCLFCSSNNPSSSSKLSRGSESFLREQPTFQLFSNLSLTESQCSVAFPGLTHEIDEAVSRGPVRLTWSKTRDVVHGKVQNRKLHLLQWQKNVDLSEDMRHQRAAALNQLYRAIITSPEPLPDTIFSLNIRDMPKTNSWSYSRRADPEATKPGDFVMPHFSFWTWNRLFIGSVDRAVTAISAMEQNLPFRNKNPRAVWRGTHWFNDVQNNHELRKRLINVASGKPWADVEKLEWETNANTAKNSLAIEDFCRYKYIIYTEGVSYSGRLLFHQACRSVILSPPISWMMHTTHLMKPIYSGTLLGSDMTSKLLDRNKRAWPTEYSRDDANIVFVSRDWSDLEATVQWLENNPGVAEGIATRQRELFNGRGYLSPASETCYWRALIKGWSQVVQPVGDEWTKSEGVSWETFSLTAI